MGFIFQTSVADSIVMIASEDPGVSLGIGLGMNPPPSLPGKEGLFIQCLIEGSAATRDGQLK